MSAKNRNAIIKTGGGDLQVLPIADEIGGGVVTDTGWVELGFIQETTLNDTTEEEDIKDETGNIVDTDEVQRVVKLSGLVMQSDKASIDFFKETVRNQYFMVYQKASSDIDGKTQEIIYGICKIKPMIEIKSGTKRIPFEITVVKNDSAIDFGGADVALPTSATVASGTINAGEYYVVTETANA